MCTCIYRNNWDDELRCWCDDLKAPSSNLARYTDVTNALLRVWICISNFVLLDKCAKVEQLILNFKSC